MRGLAFNRINIEDSRIYKEIISNHIKRNHIKSYQIKIIRNHIKIIKQLRKDIAISKPDKENGVMLLNNKDYTTSVGSLFKDTKKFRSLESDPTITPMKTLQSYLSTLHKQNELTK